MQTAEADFSFLLCEESSCTDTFPPNICFFVLFTYLTSCKESWSNLVDPILVCISQLTLKGTIRISSL